MPKFIEENEPILYYKNWLTMTGEGVVVTPKSFIGYVKDSNRNIIKHNHEQEIYEGQKWRCKDGQVRIFRVVHLPTTNFYPMSTPNLMDNNGHTDTYDKNWKVVPKKIQQYDYHELLQFNVEGLKEFVNFRLRPSTYTLNNWNKFKKNTYAYENLKKYLKTKTYG